MLLLVTSLSLYDQLQKYNVLYILSQYYAIELVLIWNCKLIRLWYCFGK